MRCLSKLLLAFSAVFVVLVLLHLPLLELPYYWDEAGYYIPAALDFYRFWWLIPHTTLAEGHTPLVMVYIGLVWRLFGCSARATRLAMTLIATATVASIYALGRRVAGREIAAWSALLLALSPLFFAQSTLVHLDLAAALFTTAAVLFVLDDRLWLFALAASLAVLSKETAAVLLPVVWLGEWWKGRATQTAQRVQWTGWIALAVPLVPLAAWTLYYHHTTGYWTGNRGYLSYNLYSTLSPARVFWTLLRRVYELFIGGFNWLLSACAGAGFWWWRKTRKTEKGNVSIISEPRVKYPGSRFPNLIFLAFGLTTIYLLLLSFVGGAILPRYLLPVMPVFYLVTVAFVMRLPRLPARLILTAAALCFVWAWFINPPYPFPFEDNLAYADFIRLHQQAADYLEKGSGQPRILTAWPATGELSQPFLGYVQKPLSIVPCEGFAPLDLANVPPDSFDLLYFYSRRWEPPGSWVERFPAWARMQEKYFDYHPQASPEAVAARYHLQLLAEMERRGQWVRIYGKAASPSVR